MGGAKTSRSLHQPTQALKVYIEVLSGFSHIYSPESLNTTLSPPGRILGATVGVEKTSGMHIPRMGEGARSLLLPGSSSRVNSWSHPLDDLPQQHDIRHLSKLRTVQHKEYTLMYANLRSWGIPERKTDYGKKSHCITNV